MQNWKATSTTLERSPTSEQKVGQAARYGAALPIAALMTIGLTVSMTALIATEFTPQDKSETASFEINPRVEDLVDIPRPKEPELLKKIETPPPPTISTIKTAEVKLPHVKVIGKKTDFKINRLKFEKTNPVAIDKDPIPLVRILPVFPARFLQGDVSGYCRVQFDISAQGLPFNVETTICTSSQLKSATVKSVQRWKYAPQMQNGAPVPRSGLETIVRFDLTGEGDEILPLPRGY